MRRFSCMFALALILLTSVQVAASDLAKETRLKNQIVDYIFDGEALMLKADHHSFLSIYMEAETEPVHGAVILMHGRGLHPNWAQVIYPLRTGLTQFGWHTLSIQMPVLDNQSTFYDYLDIMPESFPRISAAVEFLQAQGIKRIVLLAHSCSVHMAIAWLDKHRDVPVSAFIGIGMGSTDKGQPMLEPFPLETFSFPILDIRGEYDYPAVHGKAADRWRRMQQAGNPGSLQREVKDADHYFNNRGEPLLREVSEWLDRLDN